MTMALHLLRRGAPRSNPSGTTAKAAKRDKIQGNQNLTACQPNMNHDRASCSMSVQSNSRSTSLQETHCDEALSAESPEKDEEETNKNPFAVPPDFDIFSIRDKERQKAQEERERMKTMKIHEKSTYSTKLKAKQKGLRQALQQEEKEEAGKQATNEERLKSLKESFLREMARKKDDPVKKEIFRDYKNYRKEIFVLKCVMKEQQEEIQRLEEIATNEERKVEEAERNLEKDTAAFEELLMEKQKNFVQALKIAKKEDEEKTKKIVEIQEVTSQIENLQRSKLKEYKTYRNFLHQLKEWQKEHSQSYTSTGDVKTEPSASEGGASPPTTTEQGQGGTARTDAASTNNRDVPSFLLSAKTLTAKSLRDIKPQLINFLKPLSPRKMTALEDAATETSSDEDEDPELCFTDPQQLLSIFTEMEDENLSLIQKSQEAEESLKKLQQTFITTYERTEKELGELKEQVATLKSSIAKEEERAADMKRKVQLFSAEDEQDKILASLSKKVQEVYCQCTGKSKGNLKTMEMLMVLEKQLNDLLDIVERMPPEKIEHSKKLKEKEWRMKLRKEKLRQKEQQLEERLKKTLERSKAAEEAKKSKKVMFRSILPPKKQKRKPKQEESSKKEEELYFFS